MRTVHRSISCITHGVLYSWMRTDYTQAEKDQRQREYDAAIAPELEIYNQAVRRFKTHWLRRWFDPKRARGDVAKASYFLELLKNQYAPLKDDPPQIADWNKLFMTLVVHQSLFPCQEGGCRLTFDETIDPVAPSTSPPR